MIVTHTSNPSIDYYIKLDNDIKYGIQKSSSSFFLAGGKGLNVSMILNQLGIESIATAFIGGFSGSFIEEELTKYSLISLEKVAISQTNRINVKIRDNNECDINSCGPLITDVEQKAMIEIIKKNCKRDCWLIISGSFAKGINDSFLIDISEYCNNNGVKLVLDISNINNELLIKCKPYLIKPNLEELIGLFDGKYSKEEAIEQLLSKGVKSILLSKGSDGAEYYESNDKYLVKHQALKPVSTIGAGDSMLAGFVAARDNGKDIIEALKIAAACGMATTITDGLADKHTIIKMLDKVECKKIIGGK